MIPLERNGFTKQDVMDGLHARRGSRVERFVYKLLDRNNQEIKILSNVTGGDVKYSSFSEIKRTATFYIVDDGSIDFLSDRIQPVFEILINNQWISFPLGVFLLATPERRDEGVTIKRDIEAYDGLLILRDDKFDGPFTVTAGTNYKTAVIDLLQTAGITQYIIEDTDKALAVDQVFETGTNKLEAINDLLSQINFTPIRVDVHGNFVSSIYQVPNVRGIEYTYKDDALSVTYQGMNENIDLFNVANKWVVVASNAEQAPLKSVYVNENVDSPTSTINRGRIITDYREIDNIADQQSLDAYTKKLANEASQIFGKLSFETAIMPHHDYQDLLKIEYSTLNINDRFVETDWEFNFEEGSRMRHEVRRVMTI